MVKKITKYAKFAVCCALILSLVAPSYAALSASDGSAFVTKAEFDSALADFNARLTTFEAGINSKIDSQVSSYLDRNGIWNAQKQTILLSEGVFTFWNTTILDDCPQVTYDPVLLNKETLFNCTKSGMVRLRFKYGASSCIAGYFTALNATGYSATLRTGVGHGVLCLTANIENDTYDNQDSIWMNDILMEQMRNIADEGGHTNDYKAANQVITSVWSHHVPNALLEPKHYVGPRLAFAVGLYEYYTFVSKGQTYMLKFYVYSSNGNYLSPTTSWPAATQNIYFVPNSVAPMVQRSVSVLSAEVY